MLLKARIKRILLLKVKVGGPSPRFACTQTRKTPITFLFKQTHHNKFLLVDCNISVYLLKWHHWWQALLFLHGDTFKVEFISGADQQSEQKVGGNLLEFRSFVIVDLIKQFRSEVLESVCNSVKCLKFFELNFLK